MVPTVDPQLVLTALLVTLQMWAGAMLVAAVLSIFVAAGRRSRFAVVRGIARAWVGIVRGIPPLVWMIALFYSMVADLLGESPVLTAALALGLINSAYFGDSIYGGLKAVPHGQWEACTAMSLSTRTAYTRVILPQAMPIILSSSTAYSISLLKNTAIASIIGATDLVFYANSTVQLGANSIQTFFIIGLVYLAFTIPLGFLARWVEGRSVIAKVRS